jgi:hypothetical protein
MRIDDKRLDGRKLIKFRVDVNISCWLQDT